MPNFRFELDQAVDIWCSGERGVVIGRAEYRDSADSYLVRYQAADGRAVEAWWSDNALAVADAAPEQPVPTKRARPRKTADASKPQPEPQPEPVAAQPEPQPQPEPVAAQPAATLESVRARFVTLTQRGKRDALLALLAEQGVETLSKAETAQLAAIADALTALEAQP